MHSGSSKDRCGGTGHVTPTRRARLLKKKAKPRCHLARRTRCMRARSTTWVQLTCGQLVEVGGTQQADLLAQNPSLARVVHPLRRHADRASIVQFHP